MCFYWMCEASSLYVLDADGVRCMKKMVATVSGSRYQSPPQTPAALTLLTKLQTMFPCVSIDEERERLVVAVAAVGQRDCALTAEEHVSTARSGQPFDPLSV